MSSVQKPGNCFYLSCFLYGNLHLGERPPLGCTTATGLYDARHGNRLTSLIYILPDGYPGIELPITAALSAFSKLYAGQLLSYSNDYFRNYFLSLMSWNATFEFHFHVRCNKNYG